MYIQVLGPQVVNMNMLKQTGDFARKVALIKGDYSRAVECGDIALSTGMLFAYDDASHQSFTLFIKLLGAFP